MLALLDPRLDAPWRAEARFHRPLYLPGRAALRWREDRDIAAPAGAIRVEVRHATTGEPRLAGLVTTAGNPG